MVVRCETPGCARRGEVLNTVRISGDEGESAEERAEAFLEAFGHGGEEPADVCPACQRLGVASEPQDA